MLAPSIENEAFQVLRPEGWKQDDVEGTGGFLDFLTYPM